MCEFIKGSYVAPGWGCCACRVYNGLQRQRCKSCGAERHEPLDITGDSATGMYYEGGQTEVEILAVSSDGQGYGISLRSKGGDIPAGHEWRSWTAYDAGANSCWRLE